MRIFRSRSIKKIVGFAIIMGCSGIFLNGQVGIGESVHALQAINDGTTGAPAAGAAATTTSSIWQTLNMVLKLIYLLLWPLLVVAGLALDNTLVYASVFHLDAPLWQFRNMMKNFANFTLGFMVLFAIIKSIFSNSGAGSAKDEKSPLGIIKVTLIAGILIQASRFLMAALVDVSTIATYAVGGLPLSVLKNTKIGDQKILAVNSSLNLNKFEIGDAGGKEFQIWNTAVHSGMAGDKIATISPCKIAKSYIIGREYSDTKYRNTSGFVGTKYEGLEICTLNGNQLAMWPENKFFTELGAAIYSPTGYNAAIPAEYDAAMAALLTTTGWDTKPYTTGNLINISSSATALATGTMFFGETTSLTIATLIEKSKGFVGPLVTMYSSLLNFAQLTDTNITSTSGASGIFIIKSLVAIALFFPLIALALVLIARVGVLRLYIVASPFIILKESFKNFVKIKGLDEYLSLNGVIGIIFAPVITVAALSISLIFMTALVNGFSSSDSTAAIHETLGIQTITPINTGYDAVAIGGVASLEFSRLPRGAAMDWFSRLMVNFFAIGLMRMIFFAALKSSELGKTIGGQVEKIGENVFKTMPILPIAGGVGVGSAAKVLGGVPDRWIADKTSEQNAIVNKYVYGEEKGTPPTTIDSTLASTLITPTATADSITKGLTDKGVKTTDVETVLTGSVENIGAAITALNINSTESDKLAKAVNAASNNKLGDAWYTTYVGTATAKTALDANIKANITDAMTTVPQIESQLNIAANKILLDKYFSLNTTANTYVATVGATGKQITITKPTASSGTYTSTVPTAPIK